MKFDTLLAEIRHQMYIAPRLLNRVNLFQRCMLAESEKDVADSLCQLRNMVPPQVELIETNLEGCRYYYGLTSAGKAAAVDYETRRDRAKAARKKPRPTAVDEAVPSRVLSHQTPAGVEWFIDSKGGIEIVPPAGQASAVLDPESASKLGRMLALCEDALEGSA